MYACIRWILHGCTYVSGLLHEFNHVIILCVLDGQLTSIYAIHISGLARYNSLYLSLCDFGCRVYKSDTD